MFELIFVVMFLVLILMSGMTIMTILIAGMLALLLACLLSMVGVVLKIFPGLFVLMLLIVAYQYTKRYRE